MASFFCADTLDDGEQVKGAARQTVNAPYGPSLPSIRLGSRRPVRAPVTFSR